MEKIEVLVTIFFVVCVKCEENNCKIKDLAEIKALIQKPKDPPLIDVNKIPSLNNIKKKDSYTDQYQIYHSAHPGECPYHSYHNQLQYIKPIYVNQLKEIQTWPPNLANALQYQPVYPRVYQRIPYGYHQGILTVENYQNQPYIVETESSHTKDTSSVETTSKTCQNPNCKCQNCKCIKCQCSDMSRHKREPTRTKDSKCKCQNCKCSDISRNKRDLSNSSHTKDTSSVETTSKTCENPNCKCQNCKYIKCQCSDMSRHKREPTRTKDSKCKCQNCKCSDISRNKRDLSHTRDTSSVETTSKTCGNPNCKCQNCKCIKCQCSDMSRHKREPTHTKDSKCKCQNCKCSDISRNKRDLSNSSHTKDTSSVETTSTTCENPNCKCQNCKCIKCECSAVSRHKREPTRTKNSKCTCQNCKCSDTSRNKRDLSNPCQKCSNKCQECHCQKKDQRDCRNKRHVEDFGNSVSKFFTSLFPQQFKDLHSAVKHVHGSSTTRPQKASLLEQLNDIHKKNNPQYYNSPNLNQKYSMVSKIAQKPNYFDPNKNILIKNPLKTYRNKYGQVPRKSGTSVNPILEMQYKKIKKELDPTLGAALKKSRFVPRTKPKNEVNQKLLLKKLKRLNNNYLDPKLESQATDFMKKCMVPSKVHQHKVKIHSRNAMYNPDTRPKRTIILGSDELDLPTHYEIEVVSEEDESKKHIVGNRNNNRYKNQPDEDYEEETEDEACSDEEPQSFEQLEGYTDYSEEPTVQQSYPLHPPSLLHQKYPSLFNKKPAFAALAKPDVIIGKNVIKKAVQEELNNFQKKQEREHKLKEIKEKRKNPFGIKNKSGASHNPMMMLFNAPIDFLKQFHTINKKSINPMMTTLPNLVYTAKKYFRNFGKDFKNNCMDLASNIIGDFDNVNPNVIESIVQPGFQRRHKREIKDKAEQIKPNEKYAGVKNKEISKKSSPLSIGPQYTLVFKSSKEEKDHDDKNLKLKNSDDEKLEDFKKQKVANKVNKEIIKTRSQLTFEPQYTLIFKSSKEDYTDKSLKEKMTDANIKVKNRNLQPEYSIVFESSQEIKGPLNKISKDIATDSTSKDLVSFEPKKSQNVLKQASSNVRKKRYVIKVVDSDEVQSQVEEYLKRELNFRPIFENRHKPIVQPKQESVDDYDYFLESSEERPTKKKIQIKKVKPRVIIDNKGLAFMEYNGIKRPLLFGSKKKAILPKNDKSSEEKEGKIDMLIQRAKEHTDLVGSTQNAIVPQKVIKERITHLLNEIDSLVNSNLEMYDVVCEDLIKVHQIKISIEEDWKRLLIDNKIDDIEGKIETLEKLKDLQNVKNLAVKHIGETLQKNNNEFVRKMLISILAKLQRLQSLITSVVEDFETRFEMKTPFNTKKEIKFVDYLSDLKFITQKTRNDLVKNIGKIRDEEVQKDIELLNKLKKFLNTEEDEEKLEEVAKIIWEMMNACKLQKDTVKEMNKKLSRNQNVKKELKILFDLQSRFDEANLELQESLDGVKVGKLDNEVIKKGDKPHKKDLKEILADIKRKQEEWIKKFKKSS